MAIERILQQKNKVTFSWAEPDDDWIEYNASEHIFMHNILDLYHSPRINGAWLYKDLTVSNTCQAS